MNTWGKSLAIALSTSALLAVSACSTPAANQQATVTVTSSAAPSSSAAPTAEAPAGITESPEGVDMDEVAFIRGLRNSEENFDPADDDALMNIGRSFCEMYDNGATSEDINSLILTVMGPKYTLRQLTAVHGYGVGAFCQEHIGKL